MAWVLTLRWVGLWPVSTVQAPLDPAPFEWLPVILTVISVGGTIMVGYWTRTQRQDPATLHVARADQVVDMSAAQLERIQKELLEALAREKVLERRVVMLEEELVKFGVDPRQLPSPRKRKR